jgi:Domain of unknown function (DUF1902)
MSKPVIFTISAAWDDEAAVWTGHCDESPAAADAPTLDELLAKPQWRSICCPTIIPRSTPEICFCKSPRSAKPSRPLLEWRRNSIPPKWAANVIKTCPAPRARRLV